MPHDGFVRCNHQPLGQHEWAMRHAQLTGELGLMFGKADLKKKCTIMNRPATTANPSFSCSWGLSARANGDARDSGAWPGNAIAMLVK